MVHLHARDDDEEPTWRPERFAEICSAVVDVAPEMVLVVTPSGRNWSEAEKRMAALTPCGSVSPSTTSRSVGYLIDHDDPLRAEIPPATRDRARADTLALARRIAAQLG